MFYPPAQYQTLTLTGAAQTLVSGRVVLLGFSATNTSATVAGTVSVFDGPTTNPRLFLVNLNPSESTREWFGPMGIALEQGLVALRATLTCEFCAFFLPESWVQEAGGFAYPDRVG